MRLALLFLTLVSVVGHAQTQADPRELTNSDKWMAVIGDSGSTGAASESYLQPNIFSLGAGLFTFLSQSKMTDNVGRLEDIPSPARFGINEIEPVTRVVYSQREFDEKKAQHKETDINMAAKGSLALDVEEHTNGYLLGRSLGMRGHDIVFVGQDGVKVSAIPTQFERIFEMKTKTLPPLILVSFTANDFCGNSTHVDPLADLLARFQANLDEAWEKSKPFLISHAMGTKIEILAPLDVANILTNQALLQQTVEFQGIGKITCASLAEKRSGRWAMTGVMQDSLGGMCNAVMKVEAGDTVKIQRLRDVQNGINEIWKAKVAALNAENSGRGLTFNYVEQVRQIDFQAGDLANDCFHPSVYGHARIAELLLGSIR